MTTDVQAPEMVYVFCPEEPELRILVGGRLWKFSNTRLALHPGQDDVAIEFFRGQGSKYLISVDLRDPMLQLELKDRLVRTMARRADASNPTTIFNDAHFMVAAATTQEGVTPLRPVDLPGALSQLARIMPRSVQEQVLPYEQATRADADARAIAAGIAQAGGDPDQLTRTDSDAGLPESFTKNK